MNLILNRNFLGIMLFVGAIYLLYIGSGILAPFIAAFIVSYLLSPIVEYLCEKIKLPRWLVSLTIVTFFVILFILLWIILIPQIYSQIAHFVGQIPKYRHFISNDIYPKIVSLVAKFDPSYVSQVQASLDQLFSVILQGGVDMVNKIWQSGHAVINIITIIFLVPLISFYMIRDWNKLHSNIMSIVPVQKRSRIEKLLQDMNIALSGFIRGQLNVCLILAIYYSLALSFVGLKYGIFIGITTGLVSFIPFIGLASGFITSFIVAYFQFASWTGVLSIVGVFVIGNLIESFLSPKIVGNKIGLHPVWVIFALFLGAAIFGFFGMLIAIPIAAVIGVLVKFFLEMYKESGLFNTKKIKAKK